MLASSFGATLKLAREVRELSTGDAARAAGISAAYLSRLESDAVKRPSPPVLHQLSEALGIPYAELMRLSGYRVPGDEGTDATHTVGAALFGGLTDGRARGAARVPRLVSGSPAFGPSCRPERRYCVEWCVALISSIAASARSVS